MPFIQKFEGHTGFLAYDAPVDEKTKKLRERFNVDEESGYQEHYKWRGLARLGKSYKHEEPFLKLTPYEPESEYGQRVFGHVMATLVTGAALAGARMYQRQTIWMRPQFLVGFMLLANGLVHWGWKHSMTKQAQKTAILIDYCQQHPDRFSEHKRYKMREVLLYWQPIR